jgi:hypothetical protein
MTAMHQKIKTTHTGGKNKNKKKKKEENFAISNKT